MTALSFISINFMILIFISISLNLMNTISIFEKPENSDSNDQKQFDDHLDIDQHVHKQGYKASDINDHDLEGREVLWFPEGDF
jgi:hypothetical protein